MICIMLLSNENKINPFTSEAYTLYIIHGYISKMKWYFEEYLTEAILYLWASTIVIRF